MKRAQRIYWWTSAAFLVGVLVHLVWYVLQMRDQPPTDEVYTQTLSFQVAAFALTWIPYWVVALLLALVIEFAVFGRAGGRKPQ